MCQCTEPRYWFVEHLSQTYAAQQSVTKLIPLTMMNLVAPTVGAKHELLFKKLASEIGLLHIKVRLMQHNKVDQIHRND